MPTVRERARVARRTRAYHHHVYVVELAIDVLREPRFLRANPDYLHRRPCVYVGMTGLSPDERFDKHKAGIKSNKFVRAVRLAAAADAVRGVQPHALRGAQEMEVELAIALREEGYGVWQG